MQLISTHSDLIRDFAALGVRPGAVLMLHASVKAVGKVMGGPDVILSALRATLGTAGTLMMYAGWEDIPDFVGDLPTDQQQLYYAEHPPFDPATARAVRDHSILAEFFRTLPGTLRSANAEASIIALGRDAAWIVADHPLNYGFGAGSPLAKLVEARGQVLMLGAPLDTITLLHYAENIARLPAKRIVRYQYPVLRDGEKIWIDVEDFDTGTELDDYTFEQIARAYLAHGGGQVGQVGQAQSYLFDAADLIAFAVRWLEENFG